MTTESPREPMRNVEGFETAYATGDTPWDSGVPSAELVRVLAAGLLPGKTAFEVGCGTGTNAIEFARRGYRVTAIDFVETAVKRARAKAGRAGVRINFLVGDATKMELGGPYDVVFDRGVYHGARGRDLAGFLKMHERVTRPGLRWLCLAGNASSVPSSSRFSKYPSSENSGSPWTARASAHSPGRF